MHLYLHPTPLQLNNNNNNKKALLFKDHAHSLPWGLALKTRPHEAGLNHGEIVRHRGQTGHDLVVLVILGVATGLAGKHQAVVHSEHALHLWVLPHQKGHGEDGAVMLAFFTAQAWLHGLPDVLPSCVQDAHCLANLRNVGLPTVHTAYRAISQYTCVKV